MIPVVIQIGHFWGGYRLALFCRLFEGKYLADDNLSVASLLPETDSISGVKKIVYIKCMWGFNGSAMNCKLHF